MKIYILAMLLVSGYGFSQIATNMSTSDSNNITYGGNIGVSAAGGGFGINVSPRIGYRVSPDTEIGVMGSYNYLNTSTVTWNNFAVGPFANYYIGRTFYLTGMYQHLFLNASPKANNVATLSKQEEALYLGGGYMSRLGQSSFFQIGFLYNVLWNKNSSMASAFVPQAGVVFGL